MVGKIVYKNSPTISGHRDLLSNPEKPLCFLKKYFSCRIFFTKTCHMGRHVVSSSWYVVHTHTHTYIPWCISNKRAGTYVGYTYKIIRARLSCDLFTGLLRGI